jgi:hypothetical protein
MTTSSFGRAARRCLGAAAALAMSSAPAWSSEVWIAPTYQQDVGGLGIGSNSTWAASAIGVVRFVVAVPDDLQAFQSAKVVLIPHSPGGAANLNVVVCAAQNGNPVSGSCAGPFAQAFNGVVNQLTEVDISSLVAPRVPPAGTNYLAIDAFSTPTTLTDHIVGMRFAYTSKAPAGAATLGANTFTDSQTVQTSNGLAAVAGLQTAGSGLRYGVEGQSDSGNGIGVYGKSTASGGGASYGVYGDASSNLLSGTGVYGTGTSYGVYGQSTRIGSTGVYGASQGTVGLSYGVFGDATANTSASGIGVFGQANGFGLYGQNMSSAAATAGVWGDANVGNGAVYGVGGQTNSPSTNAAGVIGKANAGSGLTFGLQGKNASNSTDAAAVRGDANGASGSVFGGYFRSASTLGTGVLGWAPAGSGGTFGVRGEADSTSGTGVFGYAPNGNQNETAYGVRGQSDGSNGIGVLGVAANGSTQNAVGVYGSAPNGGFGVYSLGDAYINGNGSVNGALSVHDDMSADTITLSDFHFLDFMPPCGPLNTRENQGKLLLTHGGGGDDPHLFICVERSDNSFAWKQIF